MSRFAVANWRASRGGAARGDADAGLDKEAGPSSLPSRANAELRLNTFGDFEKRRPTPDQGKRLAAIPDPKQRALLRDCITRGDHIPEFAWRPLRQLTGPQQVAFAEVMRELATRAKQRGMAPDEYVASAASYDAADVLQHGADRLNAAQFLVAPMDGLQTLDDVPDEQIVPLIGWGIFNPYGPTIVTLALRAIANSSRYVLQLSWRHPVQSRELGYAVIPAGLIGDSEVVARVVAEVFKQNGSAEHPIMAGSLPSHILVYPGGLLGERQARALFLTLVPHATPEDLPTTILQLRQFKGRPWDRAAAELQTALGGSGGRNTSDFEGPAKWPPSFAVLDAWWKCVTDNEHVRGELEQMGNAWTGSIEAMSGGHVNVETRGARFETPSADQSDFVAHFRAKPDQELRDIASAPEKSFRPGAWAALQAELRQRGTPTQKAAPNDRSSRPVSRDDDVSDKRAANSSAAPENQHSWHSAARAAASGVESEIIHRMTAAVIATDPRFAAFRQPGYPNDALVAFPWSDSTTSTDGRLELQGVETMWVRILAPAREVDAWMGRLLNAPVGRVALKKNDYVIVICNEEGLFYQGEASA